MSQILVFFFCTRPLVSTQALEIKSKRMRSRSSTTSSSSYECGPDVVDLYSDADQRAREDQKVDKTLKVLIFFELIIFGFVPITRSQPFYSLSTLDRVITFFSKLIWI